MKDSSIGNSCPAVGVACQDVDLEQVHSCEQEGSMLKKNNLVPYECDISVIGAPQWAWHAGEGDIEQVCSLIQEGRYRYVVCH